MSIIYANPPPREKAAGKRLAIERRASNTERMKSEAGHAHGFRLGKSREKLELAAIMLQKGRYAEAVRCSYLSMFYAVRMLLVDSGTDSDNPKRIIELAERYFEPAGWSALDLGALLAEPEGPAHREMPISRSKAEMFYGKARETLNRIEEDGPPPVA